MTAPEHFPQPTAQEPAEVEVVVGGWPGLWTASVPSLGLHRQGRTKRLAIDRIAAALGPRRVALITYNRRPRRKVGTFTLPISDGSTITGFVLTTAPSRAHRMPRDFAAWISTADPNLIRLGHGFRDEISAGGLSRETAEDLVRVLSHLLKMEGKP